MKRFLAAFLLLVYSSGIFLPGVSAQAPATCATFSVSPSSGTSDTNFRITAYGCNPDDDYQIVITDPAGSSARSFSSPVSHGDLNASINNLSPIGSFTFRLQYNSQDVYGTHPVQITITDTEPPESGPTPTLGYFTAPPWPHPFNFPCSRDTGDDPEFHPLRPYPGNPCDPLIPRKIPWASEDERQLYLTPQCGKSLNVSGTVTKKNVVDICNLQALPNPLPQTPAEIDPLLVINWDGGPELNESQYYICDPAVSGPNCTPYHIYFFRRVVWDVRFNLDNTSLPLMGNTEMTLADVDKVNNYLNWYLNGTLFQSEKLPVNAWKDVDRYRIVNFSGPLNKLLPKYVRDDMKGTVVSHGVGTEYHNYLVACQKDIDDDYVLKYLRDALATTIGNFIDVIRIADILMRLGWELLPNLGRALYRAATLIPEGQFDVQHLLVIFLIDPALESFADRMDDLNTLVNVGRNVIGRIGILIQDLRLDVAESCENSVTRIRLENLDTN